MVLVLMKVKENTVSGKQKFANGEERITLYKLDATTEIYYNPGSVKYYMDDLNGTLKFNHNLQKQYNIRLISWDYTQPINNN